MILLLTATSLYMTGVIWVVQLLVYPNFERYRKTDFPSAMKHHARNISAIVMLPMLVELGISLWWLYDDLSLASIVHVVLLAVIWVSTFSMQVPAHNQLQNGKNSEVIQFLVRTNWIRTAAWTIKSFWLFRILFD